jgi:hypothetical protein
MRFIFKLHAISYCFDLLPELSPSFFINRTAFNRIKIQFASMITITGTYYTNFPRNKPVEFSSCRVFVLKFKSDAT